MGKSTISMVIFNSYFDITRGYHNPPDIYEALSSESNAIFSKQRPAAQDSPSPGMTTMDQR